MAFGSFGVVSLLFALLSGGANDLLDFVSTDAYWKAKTVNVSIPQLTDDLKTQQAADVSALIKDLGSTTYAQREEAARKILAQGPAALPSIEKAADDPDAEVANRARTLVQQIRLNSKANSVRRLMAIRTLGEKKDPEALPTLRPLLESKEMFVADYAARAIAQIENKPLPIRKVSPDALKSDLAMLPANCAVIGQIAFTTGKVASLDDMLKSMPAQPGENRDAAMAQFTTQIIQLVDQIGNVRLEGITFGVADKVGPDDGFFAAIVHGQYDSRAVGAYMSKLQLPTNTIAGVQVMSPESELAFAFPGDDRALFTSGAKPEKLPVKEVLEAIAKPPVSHPLLKEAEFAPFLASLKEDARAWAICKVSDSYRAAPVIQPFDTFTLVGKQNKDKLDFRIDGVGKDAAGVKSAVDQVNQGLNEAKNTLPRLAQQMPAMKPLAEFVTSIQCEADGNKASLTSAFQGEAASLFIMPMMFGAGQAQPIPPQPVAPPPLPPVQPANK